MRARSLLALCGSLLLIHCGGGARSAQAPVPLTPGVQSFTADPAVTTYGGTSLLRWTTLGDLSSLALNGEEVLGSYQREVQPRHRQSYTLKGVGSFGTSERTLRVAAQGLDLVAGALGGLGNADGLGASARIAAPVGITADGRGGLIFADAGALTVRRVDAAGRVTTLAGTLDRPSPEPRDGTGREATFANPFGVCSDGAGGVYLADYSACHIRRITAEGQVVTLAGRALVPGYADGPAAAAQFAGPSDVALGPGGELFVADSGNHCIRRISPTGEVDTLTGVPEEFGARDGALSEARFLAPYGLEVVGHTLYVIEAFNHTLRAIDLDAGQVTTVAGRAGESGSADGDGATARFSYPTGLVGDGAGRLYVCDSGNSTIRVVDLQADQVWTLAGDPAAVGHADGQGAAATFAYPMDLAIAPDGALLVADTSNGLLRRVTLAGAVTTFAGRPAQEGLADGPAEEARFAYGTAAVLDRRGNRIVLDSGAQTLRKVAPDGTVTTFAGQTGQAGYQDGPGATALFNSPSKLAYDPVRDLVFISDTGNNAIRTVDAEGRVGTLAGDPTQSGAADGVGGAATFDGPTGLTLGPDGSLFVIDANNVLIRRISPAGEVKTIAGQRWQRGLLDGPADQALFLVPRSLAAAPDGALVLSDGMVLRRLVPKGGGYEVSTWAGNPYVQSGRFADGQGSLAHFNEPGDLAFGPDGTLYVADVRNFAVRRVDAKGQVGTVMGGPTAGGVNLGPLDQAGLNFLRGLGVTPEGDLLLLSEGALLQLTAPEGR